MFYIIKMSFSYIVYCTSQFKMLSNLSITKNLAKQNTVFNFIICFTRMKVLVFSLKNTKRSYNKWLKFQLKLFNT